MFSAWGDIAFRWRKIIPIVVIAAIVALFAIFGTQLGQRMSQEGWDDPHSQSTRAAQIEEDTFGRDSRGDVILLVSTGKPNGAMDPRIRDAITRQLRELQAAHPDNIASVTSFFDGGPRQMASADGSSAFATLGMRGVKEDVMNNYRAIEPELRSISVPGATVEIAGATAVSDSLDQGMTEDVHRAEIFALPAVGLLLLIVFGGLIAACMPLLVGVLSIGGSMGVLAILAQYTQINVFAQSVVTLLGLGLAIDYGLFMVSRFREEMAEDMPVRQAVRNTTATAGKTVVFSAAMVAVALSGLLIFPQAFLKSVAFGAMSAVALAALLSVAVLPSIFALLGPNIDKGALRRRTPRTRDEVVNSRWGKIPTFAMRHARLVTLAVVAGLIALTLPIAGIKFGGINETYLPPKEPTRVAQAHFNETFPQFRTDPVKLVITGSQSAVGTVYQKANKVSGLTGPFQVSRPTKDGVTVLSAGIGERKDYERVVSDLENIRVDGTQVLVAGTPAMEVESLRAMVDKLPWMLAYIVAVSFVLMALIFGSLIIPAKAVIMNILGAGATLGMLTLLFVDGVGSGLFGYTAGPLMSPVLVLIVAIIFGLSTDYEVFLVSRMVEARAHGLSTDKSIRFGTATTGGIITAAALIMIVVCGAFGFSNIVMMKYIAFGMVIALILDATIIRMLLVPAVMHLLREDNWWAPQWVHRLSQKVGHNETLPVAIASGGRHEHTEGAVPFQELMERLGRRPELPPAPEPAALPAPDYDEERHHQ
ncbi:MMPL family transporter [Corynebacterium heidelbergense]|uniref:RND transporter n=1 Tax=Corynebacterium heidelbergense TaxID=2055947 RepID=A0A364VCJ5_9CORY|nr:MMPL family transporter [Corynebacterium heidelbergense]RAV34328.1 RND transporter [Corynebacterium heidelbergense]WCZ35734.1 Membrane protein YdfJ [Corynebacterium heidelbergense]